MLCETQSSQQCSDEFCNVLVIPLSVGLATLLTPLSWRVPTMPLSVSASSMWSLKMTNVLLSFLQCSTYRITSRVTASKVLCVCVFVCVRTSGTWVDWPWCVPSLSPFLIPRVTLVIKKIKYRGNSTIKLENEFKPWNGLINVIQQIKMYGLNDPTVVLFTLQFVSSPWKQIRRNNRWCQLM